MAREGDLKPQPFPTLTWDQGKVVGSLEDLFKYVTGDGERAISWYETRRGKKRMAGWLFRAGAILASALAAAIPVLAESFPMADGKLWIRPGLASIAVIVAGTLIAFDRFSDATPGWLRYMAAQQDIGEALQGFRIDWELFRLAWAKPEPTMDQIVSGITRCHGFLTQVHSIVRQETNAWVSEFQNVLKQMDESAKTAVQVKQPGAISVKVSNGDQCAAPGWTLVVESGTPQTCTGKEVAVANIAPGVRTVAVTGKINNQEKRAQKAVVVAPGAVASVELLLE